MMIIEITVLQERGRKRISSGSGRCKLAEAVKEEEGFCEVPVEGRTVERENLEADGGAGEERPK